MNASPEALIPARGLLVLRLIERYDALRATVHRTAGSVLVTDSILLLAAAVLATGVPEGHGPSRGPMFAVALLIAVGVVLLCASAYNAVHAMPHVIKQRETTTGTKSSLFFNARHTVERFEDLPAFVNAFTESADDAILQDALSELWMTVTQHVALHHALRKGMKLMVQGAIVLSSSMIIVLALRTTGH